MEAVILTIITGFFSLAGIWYQNYLSRKPVDTRQSDLSANQASLPRQNQQSQQSAATQTRPNTLRIIFTILIAALPWFTVKTTQELSDKLFGTHYSYTATRTQLHVELITFTGVWVLIMVIALLSGWKRKTVFERLVLIGSAGSLIFFCFSQIV